MALKLAGEEIGIQERFETVVYSPGLPNSGDLEGATKTITATSKPGSADYSKALTLAKPSDARLEVLRIAARLQATRDSGTSNNLYCTVSIDSADGSTNKLFDSVDIQAASLHVVDTHSGNKATIFNLLKDGSEHTFYFFFWVDSGDSVISLVQLWEGVGTTTINWALPIVISLDHVGLLNGYIAPLQAGGSLEWRFYPSESSNKNYPEIRETGNAAIPLMGVTDAVCRLTAFVDTSIVVVYYCEFVMRSIV